MRLSPFADAIASRQARSESAARSRASGALRPSAADAPVDARDLAGPGTAACAEQPSLPALARGRVWPGVLCSESMPLNRIWPGAGRVTDGAPNGAALSTAALSADVDLPE